MSNVAKPCKVLIIIGVLKAYVKRPLLFFIGTILTYKKFSKSIKVDLPKEFVNTNGLVAWIYIRLQKRVAEPEAFEIVRAIFLCLGLAIQQANFRCVEDERTFENLVKNQKLVKESGTTKLNKMEIIIDTEKVYHYKVTRCMFYEFFSALGAPELTTIFCSIDNAIFTSYLPEKITFHRNGINNTMPNGAKYCTFVMENNLK